MQSGIGPACQLENHQIPRRCLLESVGENLQDHLIFPIVHALNNSTAIEKSFSPSSRLEYLRNRTGPLASNLAEVGAFLCLPESSARRKARLAQSLSASEQAPEVQIHFTPNHYLEYPIRENPTPAFSIGVTLLHPKSRGSVRLSATEKSGFAIDPNYLGVDSDWDSTLVAIELASQYAERSPLANHLRRSSSRASFAFTGTFKISDRSLLDDVISSSRNLPNRKSQ